MQDETAAALAGQYIKLIIAEFGRESGRSVLEEMALAYFVYLGTTEGREAIERLMRERINMHLIRRTHRKIELVVDNARVG